MHYLALQLPSINGSPNSINVNGIPADKPGELAIIINAGIDLMIAAAIFVCLFMLMLGGFEWIFSQGDKQKIANARQRLAMSILGLVLIFASFLIINVLYAFFFGSKIINFLGSQ
ncbi:MAG TPA: hypothetical protein VMR77_03955 [Patescibacteria group bacterium]|jgi:cbb3-type cytochrome oxidase subunit 3|nr:hypothetical protein [Patescibacteria group bacterium]